MISLSVYKLQNMNTPETS